MLWDLDERVVEFRNTEYSRLQAELDMVRAASRLLTDKETVPPEDGSA